MLLFYQLRRSHALDSKLQMVHLSQMVDHFLVIKHLILKVFESESLIHIVHLKTLGLLVLKLDVVKLAHEQLLFVEEQLLASAIDQLFVDLLGKNQDVVKRRDWDASYFESEL